MENKVNQYSCFVGNPLWNVIQFYELTEIMRQKEDSEFAQCLNRLARGKLTFSDLEMLKSREITETTDTESLSSCIHLFSRNAQVDAYNKKKIIH